jgi:hypothetical protein
MPFHDGAYKWTSSDADICALALIIDIADERARQKWKPALKAARKQLKETEKRAAAKWKAVHRGHMEPVFRELHMDFGLTGLTHTIDIATCLAHYYIGETFVETICEVYHAQVTYTPKYLFLKRKFSKRCAICMDALTEYASDSCGHVVACRACANDLMLQHCVDFPEPKKDDPKCPICRKAIQMYVHVAYHKCTDAGHFAPYTGIRYTRESYWM